MPLLHSAWKCMNALPFFKMDLCAHTIFLSLHMLPWNWTKETDLILQTAALLHAWLVSLILCRLYSLNDKWHTCLNNLSAAKWTFNLQIVFFQSTGIIAVFNILLLTLEPTLFIHCLEEHYLYFFREWPIRVTRPMSDVPIFRRKNCDVWFRSFAVRLCFSRAKRARANVEGRRQLMTISRLAGRPTVAIWMRVGGINYIIARGWRHTCVWRGRRGGRTIIDDLTDGRTQHSIHDLSKLCRRGGRRRLVNSSWTRWWLVFKSCRNSNIVNGVVSEVWAQEEIVCRYYTCADELNKRSLAKEVEVNIALSIIGVSRPVLNQTVTTVWFSTAPEASRQMQTKAVCEQ